MVTDRKQSRTQTREQVKQRKKSAQKEEKITKRAQRKEKKAQKAEVKPKKMRRRIFPIWLRVIVAILLSIGALAGGLMMGYGVIGDGSPTDVLERSTWQHIVDIVLKE
ncbi:DNA-directed RNA polymerase subunit beta [Salinibacillus xinjiangensis]|uniref:DNA-directed RNA polymerase subunit beta n=1 Tax=Salinibacillus xinjiangensis TaxID=1229268 RepID=A0A6G1X5L1_9BACI|nr:DNA-directed RNA polymerase subunit beta [Salinibacillus xinjiangensis]MRG86170.1 DNA-directed RNA polymerase subunit beta [Salinibacillus xinjiangensis]